MAISEKKMQIVMNNYFEAECTMNTSIREAFEKGFRIGVQKGYDVTKEPEWKKGKWQRRKGFDCWECSQCHAVLENDGIDLAISIISNFPSLTLKQIEPEWKYMNTLEGVIKELEEMTYNPNEADYENQGYYLARDSLYYLKKYKQIINGSK